MSLSVDFSGWQVRQGVGGSQLVADEAGGERLGDELSQDYDFSGLNWTWGTPDGRANMRIDCRLEKGFGGMFVNTFLHFYLRPFRLKQETKLIVRLYTADRMKRAEVPVIATPITGVEEKGSDWVGCAVIGTREDTQNCINVLATGQQLDFLLFREKQFKDDKEKEEFEEFCDGVGPVFLDQLVKLPLPPDKIFKEVYDESFRRIADAKDESTKPPLLDRVKRTASKTKEKPESSTSNNKGFPFYSVEQLHLEMRDKHSVNFQFRDCAVPIVGTSMSLMQLKALPSREMIAAIQRHFLFVADVLRKNGIETESLIAALLGAASQDYLENMLLSAPSASTVSRLQGFFTSLGQGMINLDYPPETAVAMLYAAAGLTEGHLGKRITFDVLRRLQEQLTK